MCCDCASVPMRGSRLAGIVSIRKLMASGSAARLREQPAKSKSREARRQGSKKAGRQGSKQHEDVKEVEDADEPKQGDDFCSRRWSSSRRDFFLWLVCDISPPGRMAFSFTSSSSSLTSSCSAAGKSFRGSPLASLRYCQANSPGGRGKSRKPERRKQKLPWHPAARPAQQSQGFRYPGAPPEAGPSPGDYARRPRKRSSGAFLLEAGSTGGKHPPRKAP